MNMLDPISWAIILILLGCGLVVLEVFIPSGGLISFLAVLALLGSIYMAFQRGTSAGFTFLMITVVAVPAAVAAAFKVWPHTPMGKAFLGELPTEEETAPEDWRRELVGHSGIAQTRMMPSGAVLVDGKQIDAISRGTPIDPGTPIVVVEVKANRVVVRLADEEDTKPEAAQGNDILSKPIDELGLESIDDPLA